MKHFFAFFLISICSLNAFALNAKCGVSIHGTNKTIVLFVNGINNSDADACASSEKLTALIGASSISAVHLALISDGYDRTYFFNKKNWGGISDVDELTQQALDSGIAFQLAGISNPDSISPSDKTAYYKELGALYKQALTSTYNIRKRNADVTQQLMNVLIDLSTKYERIVVVSHSQGNFYIESAYARLIEGGLSSVADKIKVVGVASVAATTPNDTYITNSGDVAVYKAQWLAALPSTIYKPLKASDTLGFFGTPVGFFHSFDNVYLTDSFFSPEKNNTSYRLIIREYIKKFMIYGNSPTPAGTLKYSGGESYPLRASFIITSAGNVTGGQYDFHKLDGTMTPCTYSVANDAICHGTGTAFGMMSQSALLTSSGAASPITVNAGPDGFGFTFNGTMTGTTWSGTWTKISTQNSTETSSGTFSVEVGLSVNGSSTSVDSSSSNVVGPPTMGLISLESNSSLQTVNGLNAYDTVKWTWSNFPVAVTIFATYEDPGTYKNYTKLHAFSFISGNFFEGKNSATYSTPLVPINYSMPSNGTSVWAVIADVTDRSRWGYVKLR